MVTQNWSVATSVTSVGWWTACEEEAEVIGRERRVLLRT